MPNEYKISRCRRDSTLSDFELSSKNSQLVLMRNQRLAQTRDSTPFL